MKLIKKDYFFGAVLSLLFLGIFFHKTIFFGLSPFPGDLLVSTYAPFNSFSYLGYNPGSFPQKFQYFDVIRQLYPWKNLAIDMLKSGQIPLWNPYNFSGAPLLANNQSAVFYPLNILFVAFGMNSGWDLYIVSQFFLVFIFTYLYARKIGLNKIPAVFSSIAFSYCLFLSSLSQYGIIIHTILWLPLSLFAIEKMVKKITPISVIILALSIVFSALAGHIQLFTYSFAFLLIYGLFKFSQTDLKTKAIFIAISFISLGIASFQFLPLLELIKLSARSAQNYSFLIKTLLLQPNQLILFLSPDFYGNPATNNYLLSNSYAGSAVYVGLAPLIFALSALFNFKKEKLIKFYSLFALVVVIFLLRSPLTEVFYKINIPLLSTSSPSNSIFILSFCLAILAGFGLQKFLKDGQDAFKSAGIILLIFLSVWGFIVLKHPSINLKNFLISSSFLIIIIILAGISRLKSLKKISGALIILLTAFELLFFFLKFNPFVPKALIFPKTPVISFLQENAGFNRFWGYGSGFIEANFASQYHLFDPDGYDPLYPKWYGEFLHASQDGKLLKAFSNETRSDAVIAKGYGKEAFISNKSRFKLLNLLGIEFFLDKDNTVNSSIENEANLKEVKSIGQWKIFKNNNALDRVFITNNVLFYKNSDEFNKYFFDDKYDLKTLLLEEKVSLDAGKINSFAKIESYLPRKVVISAQTDKKSMLFLSDTFYPGWNAYVDGKETKIYKADYAFRSIVLPPGSHKVMFKYSPRSFYFGVIISLASSICLLMLIFFTRRLKAHEK